MFKAVVMLVLSLDITMPLEVPLDPVMGSSELVHDAPDSDVSAGNVPDAAVSEGVTGLADVCTCVGEGVDVVITDPSGLTVVAVVDDSVVSVLATAADHQKGLLAREGCHSHVSELVSRDSVGSGGG